MSGWELPAVLIVAIVILVGTVVVVARRWGGADVEAERLEADAESQERRRESRADRADDGELVDNFMRDS